MRHRIMQVIRRVRIHRNMNSIPLFVRLLVVLALASAAALASAKTDVDTQGAALVIGNRTIHTFRAPLGLFSPADRAEGARRRIEQAFEQPGGEGWTSLKPTEQGLQVELDGKPLFFVLPGDALTLAGETPEDLANRASRTLQKAWSEARERRDARAHVNAALKAALASVLLVLVLTLLVRLTSRARGAVKGRLARWLASVSHAHLSERMTALIPSLVDRLLLLTTWLLALFLTFLFFAYSLGLFVATRPASESLLQSIGDLGGDAVRALVGSLPGLFIAFIIFLVAWVATHISTEFFAGVASRPAEQGHLNAHTAPATRRIVNASLWLFAVAMAYPYLPGSHTEAFKGLSVIVGLMVSIGASGVVGQIAAGVMIVFTYALKKGEYVRIQEYEGTVTEIGLFVTRLRTGIGEEIALPNALVLGNVTRNFSRVHSGRGYVLDSTVTIGYDTPWRQVQALLIEASRSIPEIQRDPPAYVVQTALSDFYVAYKLVVQVDADAPAARARVASDLHAAILDAFNRHGVQIMSPHYFRDPDRPKLVPEAHWHAPPAGGGDAQR